MYRCIACVCVRDEESRVRFWMRAAVLIKFRVNGIGRESRAYGKHATVIRHCRRRWRCRPENTTPKYIIIII